MLVLPIHNPKLKEGRTLVSPTILISISFYSSTDDSTPLPEYGGQAVFLDGKWKVIPKKHNHVVLTNTSRPTTSSSNPSTQLPPSSPVHLERFSRPSTTNSSNHLRSPKSPYQVSTPQKGISTNTPDKTTSRGCGGLQPKSNLVICSSFNEQDPINEENYRISDENNGYTQWKNDFFTRFHENNSR